MSSTPKQSLEADVPKEEDWEVVSGAKSLSLEPVAGTDNANKEKKADDLEVSENKSNGVQEKNVQEASPVEDVLLYSVKKNEKVDEDEPQDWYQSLPTTPMNTPEYTPVAPCFLPSNRKSETEDLELSPITEEMLEEPTHNNNVRLDENVFEPEENEPSPQNPDNAEIEGSNSLRKSLEMIRYVITRLTVFLLVFSFVKWSFKKACEKIRKYKTRSENKEPVK